MTSPFPGCFTEVLNRNLRSNAWSLHEVIGNRWHWLWRAGAGYGKGARLANIMIDDKPEGARFALSRAESPPPKGHPETWQQPK